MRLLERMRFTAEEICPVAVRRGADDNGDSRWPVRGRLSKTGVVESGVCRELVFGIADVDHAKIILCFVRFQVGESA